MNIFRIATKTQRTNYTWRHAQISSVAFVFVPQTNKYIIHVQCVEICCVQGNVFLYKPENLMCKKRCVQVNVKLYIYVKYNV